MTQNNKKTIAARVGDLEKAAGSSDDFKLTVDWDNTDDSELEPGTLVIEWGPNDQIISHRVKRGGNRNAKRNTKTS